MEERGAVIFSFNCLNKSVKLALDDFCPVNRSLLDFLIYHIYDLFLV